MQGLSEIVDRRQKNEQNELGTQTVFLKCDVLSADHSSPNYIQTDPALGRIQDSEMLHNLIRSV